jgi:hypothetical protein
VIKGAVQSRTRSGAGGLARVLISVINRKANGGDHPVIALPEKGFMSGVATVDTNSGNPSKGRSA